jgi:hypothetical protein
MDDGTGFVAGPGDITVLPSGHDAWAVGDEPAVTVDWFGATDCAPLAISPVSTDEREAGMARFMIDCRKVPSEAGCTLTIAGTQDEVLDAAAAHAVARHGHEEAPELREMLRGALEPAEPALA